MNSIYFEEESSNIEEKNNTKINKKRNIKANDPFYFYYYFIDGKEYRFACEKDLKFTLPFSCSYISRPAIGR